MCGWQVKLCDPLVTREQYLSAIEMHHDKVTCNSNNINAFIYIALIKYPQMRS